MLSLLRSLWRAAWSVDCSQLVLVSCPPPVWYWLWTQWWHKAVILLRLRSANRGALTLCGKKPEQKLPSERPQYFTSSASSKQTFPKAQQNEEGELPNLALRRCFQPQTATRREDPFLCNCWGSSVQRHTQWERLGQKISLLPADCTEGFNCFGEDLGSSLAQILVYPLFLRRNISKCSYKMDSISSGWSEKERTKTCRYGDVQVLHLVTQKSGGRERGKGASSVFISIQGVPVGAPAAGTAGFVFLSWARPFAIARVQEQHRFHTKITGSGFS